ncbi:nicotinamide riboside transporter PnuC [Solitalea lacus]|uniref:nicotinamide riboside transporter PnuC n=1 Tax=Solitalea lacus TaxID=2911172 RepID=UPI001EDB021E|nr:nicotinamide riboside transporter PnuC [Solitalea lacus]UKJ08411.1 nicotinamide riboside transporter PnuC [Solitalea lacus]
MDRIDFFSIDHIWFTILGYPMSHIEFWGTIAGALAVWLSSKANIWSWPLGLINVVLFFFIFYQIQLYPDMFLQVFFFITNVIGWWTWTHPKPEQSDHRHELKVSYTQAKLLLMLLGLGLGATYAIGHMAQNLHNWFPVIFKQPSAFPYLDSFVLSFSIIGTFMMIRKKIECWILWIAVDVICTYIYYIKGVKLISIEYFVFCIIAAFGYWYWNKEYKSYKGQASAVIN